MEPRVTRRERRLHLSYEPGHRVSCAQIYPRRTPNGSTLAVYGHDRGLEIWWRGGKRRKPQIDAQPVRPQRPDGAASRPEVVATTESDDNPEVQEFLQDLDEIFDEDEDELDPDCSYPPIIQNANLDLDVQVLHLALSSTATSKAPNIKHGSRKFAFAAAACADGSLRLVSIPLAPPNNVTKMDFIQEILDSMIQIPSTGSLHRSVAVKVLAAKDEKGMSCSTELMKGKAIGSILIAAVSHNLELYQFATPDGGVFNPTSSSRRTLLLQAAAKRAMFHPSTDSAELLIIDVKGTVRLCDVHQNGECRSQPSTDAPEGIWKMAYHAPFVQNSQPPRRKHVVDAAWIMDGKAILSLLEDGGWGIWELTSTSSPSRSAEDFALNGFLGPAIVSDNVELSKRKTGAAKLAPTTPNTRRTKAEALFSGPSKSLSAAAKGGISVAYSTNPSGQTTENVVIWYNNEVYTFPNPKTIFQRSSSRSSAAGSLHTPGLAHISDLNLMNEHITSIAQFPANPSNSAFGPMNLPRDLLVSAEHRLIMLHTVQGSTPSPVEYTQAIERPLLRDQSMLDAGQLDIGGLDRMLNRMSNGDSRPRKVGFAH